MIDHCEIVIAMITDLHRANKNLCAQRFGIEHGLSNDICTHMPGDVIETGSVFRGDKSGIMCASCVFRV